MTDSQLISQHIAIRKARLDAKLTQAQLAEKIGCKQTSVCQYEQGASQILSREKVEQMAKVLGVDLTAYREGGEHEVAHSAGRVLKACFSNKCISNRPYYIGDDIYYMPAMVASHSGEVNTHCDSCPEWLDDCCPNGDCNAPLLQGAFCRKCGEPYVPPMDPLPDDVEHWMEQRREDARELLDLRRARARRGGRSRRSGDVDED